MTIKGLWKIVKKLDIMKEISPGDIKENVVVDVLGHFYPHFQNNHPQKAWGLIFDDLLPFFKNGNQITFVMDSTVESIQKKDCHQLRRSFENSAKQNFIKLERKHISSYMHKVFKDFHQKKWAKVRQVDKDSIFQYFPRVRVFGIVPDIIRAQMEADVHIGHKMGQNLTILSNDSDMLIYSNTSKLIRKIADKFVCVERNNLLSKIN